MATSRPIEQFDLKPGTRLASRYQVDAFIGRGWEGEVYKVTELSTGLTRAAKLFFPQRNEGNKAVKRSAQKLDRLRECPAVVQYYSTEVITRKGQRVTCLISEFIEGTVLRQLIRTHPARRLHPYEALCLVHALAVAIEQIHEAGEYHGDLHVYNVLVARAGVRFVPHILDFFDRGRNRRQARDDDIVDLVHMLHFAIGGKTWYPKAPPPIKQICKGMRRDLILKQFPTAARLRRHLESFDW